MLIGIVTCQSAYLTTAVPPVKGNKNEVSGQFARYSQLSSR